jgi:SulP family sulfate permease
MNPATTSPSLRQRLSRWVPCLAWPRPSAALLRGETVAALTVAVVMIPQSVAYAGLAGMPLVTGLYATFLPMLIAVLFSSSTRLSVGPSALSSVLVGASLIGLAEPGSANGCARRLAGAAGRRHAGGRGRQRLGVDAEPGEFAGARRLQPGAAVLIIASQLPASCSACRARCRHCCTGRASTWKASPTAW